MNISTSNPFELGTKLKQLLDIFRKDASLSYSKRELLEETRLLEEDLQFLLDMAVAAELIQENELEGKILYTFN
jgi:hypothetical protein